MGKRRDRLMIIAGILEITKEKSLKTQVMYRANLSFTQTNKYLEFMLKINLITKEMRNEKEVYKSTEKGRTFLKHYREMNELLENEDESNNTTEYGREDPSSIDQY